MVTLDFVNIFNVGGQGLTEPLLKAAAKYLPSFLSAVHSRRQGFYTVIDDRRTVLKIEEFARICRGKYSSVVVLGIGGSALGTTCLAQSLKHLYKNELKNWTEPKLYVLDNIDPILIKEIKDVINLKKTLFVVVTKSGGTPETLSQYFYFRRLFDQNKLLAQKHFVFVTDPKIGLLRQIANKDKITTFDIPQNVGGRFSVLTAVGLLPAALIGIDIKKLLRGARIIRDQFLSNQFINNLPFQLAAVQYLFSQKGKTIHVLMPYAQKLFRLADWYRQLLAESIGKAANAKGERVNVGITPINALGVTDQHSQSQLYNEGPFDKLMMFIRVKNLGPQLKIPQLFPHEESVAFLSDTTFNRLIDVEYEGTTQALTKNKRPNLTITIEKINEEYLGQLLMLFQGATAFLGEFFNINAFDQPGVELSKNFTKQILKNKLIYAKKNS